MTTHKGAPLYYLFYLLFVFFHHAFRPFEWQYLLWDIGSVALFLVVFFWAYRIPWSRTWLAAAVMLALGIAVGQYNQGAFTYFIYAGSLAASYPSARFGIAHVLAVCAVVAVWAFVQQQTLYIWGPGIILTFFIGIITVFEGVRERHRNSLLKQQEEIEYLAKLAERERIARDLHDLLGHSLSLITLKAELASKLFARDPERAQKEIKDIEQAARTALSEVREAVLGYRGSGVQQELKQLAQALDVAGIETQLWVESPSLTPEQENVLCFAMREAVTNIIRHAGATRASISLKQLEKYVQLTVHDNGEKKMGDEGNGLRGMRERVALIQGTFERIQGNGHTINVKVPLIAPEVARVNE